MNTQPVSIYGMFALILMLINAVILETAVVKNNDWNNVLWVTLPLLAVVLYLSQKKKIPTGE